LDFHEKKKRLILRFFTETQHCICLPETGGQAAQSADGRTNLENKETDPMFSSKKVVYFSTSLKGNEIVCKAVEAAVYQSLSG
jgi:hypothetical protein